MLFHTQSAGETRELAARLGALLQAGDVVTLSGELGSGKTTFAQGLATGLGVDEPVSSPTFTLVQEYAGRVPVWHLDVYRLHGEAELPDLCWHEMLAGGGVVVIEWPERVSAALPADRLEVRLAMEEGDARRIEIAGTGPRSRGRVAALEGTAVGASGR